MAKLLFFLSFFLLSCGYKHSPQAVNKNEEMIQESSLKIYRDLDSVCDFECDKPILLMFTNEKSHNAKAMLVDVILDDSTLKSKIENDYYFVVLDVDDKDRGEEWLNYQINEFGINMQPFFTILSPKKEKTQRMIGEVPKDKFLKFLEEGY